MGVDVRASGSGNIGATNVARTVGLRFGLATLLVDVAKGAIPVLAGASLGAAPAGLAMVGVCAVLGHVFSFFVRFRGGKGVATAAGVFLVLSPLALAGACAVFALVAVVSRIVSLASLCAGLALPILIAFYSRAGPQLWAAIVVAALLVFTHRDNLRRIVAGAEPRFRARA